MMSNKRKKKHKKFKEVCVCVCVFYACTPAFVLVMVQVVTRFAAAAVSSDEIMTKMRTGHVVLPALINIWRKRSKVMLGIHVSKLRHV